MSDKEHNDLVALATPIVTAAYEADEIGDSMMVKLMAAGVPFGKLNTLAKSIAIEEGLLIDPKLITAELTEKIETVNWEGIEDWEGFQVIAEGLATAVDGATFARAVTLSRAYAKNELDLALPKKPRSAGGGGKGRVGAIAQAVCDLIAANAAPTKQEFYDAMVPVVGGNQQHANIIYYMGLHQAVAMTVASNGEKSLTEITAELAQQANPTPGEGVSAAPRGSHSEDADSAEDEAFEDEPDFEGEDFD